MGDVVAQINHFFREALAGENRWVFMLILLAIVGAIAAIRGKLTESWVMIPLLAIAVWYAVYRWLQLRRG